MATQTAQSGDSTRRLSKEQQWFVDAWRPTTNEDAYEITRIEGEVPRELHGTFLRNGPSQKILPDQGYEGLHLFDGDGLVHAFSFDGGRVGYRGRFVENETFQVEQAEGRFCAHSVGVMVENPTDKFFLREQHNTNVVWHGGKLMALVENAFAFELDPKDLGPRGKNDFQGQMLGMSVSAHPKIDGRSGQMLIHGYQFMEPYVQLYTIEPDGLCSSAEAIDMPFASMMHDMAITENYVVFFLAPVVIDGEALMSLTKPFGDCLSWEPERGLKFGIKRREKDAPVQWFETKTPGFIFHPGNAYEENGKIVIDACTYLDPEALLASLETWRQGELKDGWYANPFLYELDLNEGTCCERQLDERAAEFPRVDPRRVGYKNRFGYALREGSGGSTWDAAWQSVVRYDREGGPTTSFNFGLGTFPSEAVFVPKTTESPEHEGFVLTVVYDAPENESYVAVLDAENIDQGPLAKAYLRERIPLGFHGNFAEGLL